jgi:NAD(P)-dependent dehydrogenase (short-subunit alcohol dehydrogenase family)
MRQDGKVAIVTGASGIGQASAKVLRQAGVRSGVCDLVPTVKGSITD